MNRKNIIIGSFVLSFLLFLLICANPIIAEQSRTLMFSSHNPPAGLNYVLEKPFFEEIEKQTEGRIKIDPFYSASLFSAPEALKAVQDNAVDIACVFPDFYPQALPAHNIFKLFPIGPEKWENILWIYNTAYERFPEYPAELEKYNQKMIFPFSLAPGSMCATYPVSSLDDLEGKKWRASSEWHLALLENLGAIPTSVPWADCYMALQTGVTDGIFTDISGMRYTKLDEVATNIFFNRRLWFGTPYLYTINLDVWNSLSKEDQDGILRASKMYQEKLAEAYDKDIDRIVSEWEEMGNSINYWSEEDEEKWVDEELLAELRARWIKRAEDLGLENAAAIMEGMNELVNEALKRESSN